MIILTIATYIRFKTKKRKFENGRVNMLINFKNNTFNIYSLYCF